MYSVKELAHHPYESYYCVPPCNKPYVKLIREDFKIVGKKAKDEMQKAYTKGFTPDYIVDKESKQPKFEYKNEVLTFIPEK